MKAIRSKRVTTNIGPRCKFQLGDLIEITSTQVSDISERAGQVGKVIGRTTYVSRNSAIACFARRGGFITNFRYESCSTLGFLDQWQEALKHGKQAPQLVVDLAKQYVKTRGMGDTNFYYVQFPDGEIERVAAQWAKKYVPTFDI